MSDDSEESSVSPLALQELKMWTNKLMKLANIQAQRRASSRSWDAPIPAHSKNFFYHLSAWHLSWRATDGSEHSGAVGITRSKWMNKDAAYGFAADQHAMIVDTHNDSAMAFLVYGPGQSVDDATVRAASAGEEGEAVFVAQTMSEYTRKAIESRFASYWFLHPDQAKKTRAWVDAQPLNPDPMFAVEVQAVDVADARALRAQVLDFSPEKDRKGLASAVGYTGTDGTGLAAALEEVFAKGKAPLQKKVRERLAKMSQWNSGSESERKDSFFLAPVDSDLRAIRLKVRRLGSAYLSPSRFSIKSQALQLLLDAPGAAALLGAVDADHLRFCDSRRYGEADKVSPGAFAQLPDKTLPKGKVHGELTLVVLLPAALVPTGCTPGAHFTSIAPASDGVIGDTRGKPTILKSI